MNSGAGDTTQLVPGSPIRTPWDHSSVDSSPRPIAASHVLHRLLVPRHPPSALSNLTTKMLASTVQFSTNNHPHTPTPRLSLPTSIGTCSRRPSRTKQPQYRSRACSFRTQQGVYAIHSRTGHIPLHSPKEMVVLAPAVAEESLPVSPPMSTRFYIREARLLAPVRGRCSLERR